MIELPRKFKPFFEPKRYKVAKGGRGSGKSTSIALILLTLAKQSKKRILCAREIQDSIADSVHKLLKDLINTHEEFSEFEVLNNLIRHKNGSEFIFKGLKYNITDLKSTEGVDICWVEEAQSVSANSWDVLIPTIREEGSEIWISFNPQFEDDPTYQRFCVAPDDDILLLNINYPDNPFFSDVLRAEMERDKKRDYNKYLHIWEGEFQKTTDAAVFKNWEIQEFEAPYKTQFMFGADWGFATDPNTLMRLFIDGRKIYFDYEAVGYQTQIEATPELWDTIPMSRQHVVRADSARPEMIDYMRRNGFNVVAASKWAGSVEDGISHLQSYDLIVHPRCKNLINELAKYSYKTHRLTGDILPDVEDDNNHCIDAIRYACEPLVKNKMSLWQKII